MPSSRQELVDKVTGLETTNLPPEDMLAPYALVKDRERKIVQGVEILSIFEATNAIFDLLEQKGFTPPSCYSILTAGMNPPADAELIGKYGEGAFASFPPTDIHGHDGAVYAVKTGPNKDQTMLILKGRAHPYEWSKDPYGDMVVAHPLQVIKEMIRRQRAENGIDPVVVLTYLTGVRENNHMKPGDLGIILDDSPGDNDTHPGQGPRALLDEWTGARFQPKDGRASNTDLARQFLTKALELGILLHPVAVVGTPGTTEFQSSVEARLYDEAFLEAASEGNLSKVIGEVFGGILKPENLAALLFCMGITAELATLRQTFPNEKDFRVLALGLATDEVGGAESAEINHFQVVTKAIERGEVYRDLIMSFIDSGVPMETLVVNSGEDFSIKKKMADF